MTTITVPAIASITPAQRLAARALTMQRTRAVAENNGYDVAEKVAYGATVTVDNTWHATKVACVYTGGFATGAYHGFSAGVARARNR